jgi:hypothetical protein
MNEYLKEEYINYSQDKEVIKLYTKQGSSLPYRIIIKNSNEYLVIDIKTTLLNKELKNQYSSYIRTDLGNELYSLTASFRYVDKDTFISKMNTFNKFPNIFIIRKINNLKDLYQLLVVKGNTQETTFIKYFGEISQDDENDDDDTVIKYKNTSIHFPDDMKDEKRQKFLRVVKDLDNLFTKHKIEKIMNRKVIFSNIKSLFFFFQSRRR